MRCLSHQIVVFDHVILGEILKVAENNKYASLLCPVHLKTEIPIPKLLSQTLKR